MAAFTPQKQDFAAAAFESAHLTVAREGMIIFTAVFECFPTQFAVARAGFVRYDYEEMMKSAVISPAFAFTTVTSEESSLDMTV